MDRDVIKVDILPEDFAKAPSGYANGTRVDEGCVLHQALQRMYPEKNIHISAWALRLDGHRYDIPFYQWGSKDGNFPIERINQLSRQAKESLEGIPTVSLTLEPY